MRFALALTAVIAAAPACSSPSEPTTPVRPLAHTFASPEALAQGVLDALARRDRSRLEALALSEAEYRVHVWPELPASRPERNLPFEYVWGQLKQRSDAALARTVDRHGGKSYSFRSIAFRGEETSYATFSVLRESEVVGADDSGREWVLQLFGSAMVKDGRYKLFSYVTDD
jgi:hypothetical protein